MAKFVMLGNYNAGVNGGHQRLAHRPGRRRWSAASGGETIGIYALLGAFDLMLIVELSDIETAMQSLARADAPHRRRVPDLARGRRGGVRRARLGVGPRPAVGETRGTAAAPARFARSPETSSATGGRFEFDPRAR